MTYGAGVLVLGHGRISHGENAICFFKIVISIPRLDSHKLSTCTGLVYSNDNEERVYLNCKFHDPGVVVLVLGRGHISHIVKMHYFFKNLLLYSQA